MPGASRASKKRTSSSIGVARTYLPHMLSERRELSVTRPSHHEAGDDQDDGDDDGEFHQQSDRAGDEREHREGDDHTDGDRANNGDGVERANAFRPASGFEHAHSFRSLCKSLPTPRCRPIAHAIVFAAVSGVFRVAPSASPFRDSDHYY